MFIIEWGHRTKFQTLPVDRVGGYFGQTLGAGATEAYGEYHDNNATSQLGWESKIELSVAIIARIMAKILTSIVVISLNYSQRWNDIQKKNQNNNQNNCQNSSQNDSS